jgi:hypothetical protein
VSSLYDGVEVEFRNLGGKVVLVVAEMDPKAFGQLLKDMDAGCP